MEPVKTIYTEDWRSGRRTLRTLASRGRAAPFDGALSQLADAWTHVRPLGHWCEANEGQAGGRPPAVDALLWHVEVEIVDLFRWIANETIRTIPRGRSSRISGSVDDLETEVEALRRNVRVLLLAVWHPVVPASIRVLVEANASALVDWSVAFGATVAAIRQYLDAAEIGEADE